MSNPEVNVGVVGATGLVGGKILDKLAEREFPVGDMRVFASQNSAGSSLSWQDRKLTVEDAYRANYRGLGITIISAEDDVSADLAERIASEGSTVIDLASTRRMDPEIPLVVTEVNPGALERIPKGIVANPNCTTAIASVALKPLHDHATLVSVDATTQQSVSGAGEKGVEEYKRQADYFVNDALKRDGTIMKSETIKSKKFPAQIYDNVISHRGKMVGEHSAEEIKFKNESRKILGLDDLKVSVTCSSVPTLVGHAVDLKMSFKDPILPEQAIHFLEDQTGITYEDLPNLRQCVGRDEVIVGRVRPRETALNGLAMWVAGDNLLKGAALNAVQIAELLVQKYTD